MDNPEIHLKWGTAPPLRDPQGNPLRAFGTASFRVVDAAQWQAASAAPEAALPILRGFLTQTLQECLGEYHGDLPALGLLVQSRAAQAFEKVGLAFTQFEIQSLENAESQPEPAFRDPQPAPPPLSPLPLGSFGLNLPVDDMRITPPEEPDEPRT